VLLACYKEVTSASVTVHFFFSFEEEKSTISFLVGFWQEKEGIGIKHN